MIRFLNFVDGEDRSARAGAWIDDVEPATGKVYAQIPRSQADDVSDAVLAAQKAGPAWAKAQAAERADLCDALADALTKRADEFAELESRDTGKPVKLARQTDVQRAIRNFRFFAGQVRHDETGSHETADALNYTIRRPIGVVGLVTPWNLPIYLLSWKVAPGIATGNTLVAKPSELTPATASALAGLFRDVGAPPGIFNLVHGFGPEAGQALVAHPGVKAVSFTGGTATGARVAATAAPRFAKLSLELGGKNSSLVFADANLDEAVPEVVRAAFQNQGQVCLCGSRILVQREIYDAFVERFVAKVESLRIGDPRDPATDQGALVSEAHREKIEGYVELAKQEGGQIRTGGSRPDMPGAFYRPTVITDLPHGCRTATEEIFGPVATIHPFDTEAEAVAIANEVRYGLAATVWTNDLRRAVRISGDLDVGMVWVNTWLLRDLRVPFGGTKDSGVGREGGRYSLDFFTESRNVCIKK